MNNRNANMLKDILEVRKKMPKCENKSATLKLKRKQTHSKYF